MATWDDVRRIALNLPETDEASSRGTAQWRVKGRGLVWERPLRRSDHEALGKGAPDGPILGVRMADLGVKEAGEYAPGRDRVNAEGGVVGKTHPYLGARRCDGGTNKACRSLRCRRPRCGRRR